MKLEDVLWIFPYKAGSKSALALAEELDVWCLKHEGSTFKGGNDKFVLNWGAGTGVFNAKLNGAKLLNTTAQVDVAVNKLDFFRVMRGDKAPRVPFWTQNREMALGWLWGGYQVVARTKLEGCKGAGVVVLHDPTEIIEAPLYTLLEASTEEYRVYLFNGKVLDSRIKLLEDGHEADPDGMRYHEDKYKYCKLSQPLPEDVALQAERCIQKIGLLTGGVDVLWDANSGKAFVLECNSAPYLGGDTAEKYAVAIKEYIQA